MWQIVPATIHRPKLANTPQIPYGLKISLFVFSQYCLVYEYASPVTHPACVFIPTGR